MNMQTRNDSAATAILSPCSNSHPFEERRIQVTRNEENAVKIGRAVARLQPAENNAIFDCKVLSRNHAIMWYEDGQFLIKDTKSSNGTFINSVRLSNSGEESVPHPLHSGDILQLGVEIVDNAKKVASGCVTCIVRLYNEKGEECFDRSHTTGTAKHTPMQVEQYIPKNSVIISEDQIFMLKSYISEQMHREKLLDQKLRHLEVLLEMAQESSENSWQALINEDRLLSRIEILESQLSVYASKNITDGELKKQIQDFLEDKQRAEAVQKELLRKAHDQVTETTMKLHDVEHSLVNLEEENNFLRRKCDQYEDTLKNRQEQFDELEAKFNAFMEAKFIEEKNAHTLAAEKMSSEVSGSSEPQFQVTAVENAPAPTMEPEATSTEDQPMNNVEELSHSNVGVTDAVENLNDYSRDLINQLLEKIHDSDQSNDILQKIETLLHPEVQEELVPEPPQAQPSEADQPSHVELEAPAELQDLDGICPHCGNGMSIGVQEREASIVAKESSRYADRVDVQVLLLGILPILFLIIAIVWPLVRIFPDSDYGSSIVEEMVKDTKLE